MSKTKSVMAQYKLTPLSYWGKSETAIPENRDVFRPFDPKIDPLAEWKTLNRALAETPLLQVTPFC